MKNKNSSTANKPIAACLESRVSANRYLRTR
jgi:hypothetical protein